MKLRIDQIAPAPEPIRKSWDEEKLRELSQSIKEQGLIVPIKVRPNGNVYEVVYGHRRLEACKMAGLGEIEAFVEGIDDQDTLIQALIENIVREDMDDVDKRDALKAIKRQTGKTWKEIGAVFGLTERRIKYLAHITDDEAKAIKGNPGSLSATHVAVTRIAGSHQKEILNKAIKEDLSRKQMKDIAESVAATKDPNRRKFLIDTPYSSFQHDPEINRQRADRFGEHDPVSTRKHQTDTSWEQLPEVKAILDWIKMSRKKAKDVIKMAEQGKFAPEARPFIARKLLAMIEDWDRAVSYLEGEK